MSYLKWWSLAKHLKQKSSTLHSLDDATLPAANQVRDLLGSQTGLEEANTSSFQEVIAKFSSVTWRRTLPVVFLHKTLYWPSVAFSINPDKVVHAECTDRSSHSRNSIDVLMKHYWLTCRLRQYRVKSSQNHSFCQTTWIYRMENLQ